MAASDMATNDIASGWDFMFTWTIENWPVSFLPSFAKSPPFHTERLLDTKWHLEIRSVEERKLLYSIHRDKRVNHNAFESERARFIVNDTLTIRCRLWNGKCFRIILPNQSFIHTGLAIERRTILWCVRALSEGRAGRPGVKYRLPHLSQIGHYVITLNLKITPNEDGERILITILEDNLPQRLGFKIYQSWIQKVRSALPQNLMAIVKEEFMKYKEFILFDDMLCVRYEFEIENGPARDPHEYKRSEVLNF
ncbi:UNVERIFIED_CONTAM: hypothetical protein NCL1_56997 [Trichonephila clavipes]